MATLYSVVNSAAGTTAAPVRVTTGTAIKTLLQVGTPATRPITVVEWSISFDGTDATKAPIQCELIQTDVGATVTDVTPIVWGPPDAPASLCIPDTTNHKSTGYTASAEGTITATRLFDYLDVDPNKGAYVKQFPLGREPVVPVSKFLRIRVTSAVAVNAVCRIVWEE